MILHWHVYCWSQQNNSLLCRHVKKAIRYSVVMRKSKFKDLCFCLFGVSRMHCLPDFSQQILRYLVLHVVNNRKGQYYFFGVLKVFVIKACKLENDWRKKFEQFFFILYLFSKANLIFIYNAICALGKSFFMLNFKAGMVQRHNWVVTFQSNEL